MGRLQQDITVERRAIRFVGTRGFFFCFAAATLAAFAAGFVRPGAGTLAFPLLVWSPFLFLISLHMASAGIDRIRKTRPEFLQGLIPAALAISTAFYLLTIAGCVVALNCSGSNEITPSWTVWVIVFASLLSSIGTWIADRYFSSYSMIMRGAMSVFGIFWISAFLAVMAVRMLITMHPRP